jgi:hypothetical protein
MACSRGRVDAESFFEALSAVSTIYREYHMYRLQA